MSDNSVQAAAIKTMQDCMAVVAGENVTIVCDTNTREIGEVLQEASNSLGAETVLTIMKPRKVNGEEPPKPIVALMMESQVLILATTVSLSHTQARKLACEAGARCASMPGITLDMLIRTMNVDWFEVAAHSQKIADTLRDTDRLHLTSDLGSDMWLNMKDRFFGADSGVYNRPGDFGNLPGGEACAGPHYIGSTGVAVFDGSFAGLGKIHQPIRVEFHDGEVIKVEGNHEAEALSNLIKPFNQPGRMLAEIGIGTHPTAIITGKVLEDEKVMGTIHLALGNNLGFGGNNDVGIHIDGIISKPTLTTAEGLIVIENGILRI